MGGVRRTSMLEETDFLKEASNIAEFGAYLDSSGMHKVATCPFVYKPFSSRRCDWHRAASGRLVFSAFMACQGSGWVPWILLPC